MPTYPATAWTPWGDPRLPYDTIHASAAAFDSNIGVARKAHSDRASKLIWRV